MKEYSQVSEFKKLWKYQTPVYAIVLGFIFCFGSGGVQPMAGIPVAGTLGALTAPKEFIWQLNGLKEKPTDPIAFANDWI